MHKAEISAQAKFNLEKACMGIANAEPDPTPEEPQAVDGPRKMNDNFAENLGQAFTELIFDFWSAVTPMSWSSNKELVKGSN